MQVEWYRYIECTSMSYRLITNNLMQGFSINIDIYSTRCKEIDKWNHLKFTKYLLMFQLNILSDVMKIHI